MKENIVIPPLEYKYDYSLQKFVEKNNLKTGEFTAACEAGVYEELGGRAFLFGTGDLSLAHKPDEYMVIKDFFEYNRLLLNLISTLDDDICSKR